MVITERIPTDNTTRVTPICSKRSNNIRVTNPYDSNCDSASNNRFSQSCEQSINLNSAHVSQTIVDSQNQNLNVIKKDRNYSENNEGKIVNNIRLSCSPITWSTNTCTSQSSDIKSDIYNRQFSPLSTPVRNRVVARVDPFSHTSSNTHNSSISNSNILSKTVQSPPFLNRITNTIAFHNVNRNVQRTLSSYPDKELSMAVKQENLMSLSKNLLHCNEREFGNSRRRTNYNQPLTYRIAKNPDAVSKSFDNRTPIFSGVHKLKSSKSLNYKVSEHSSKQITAAEVFGEDFSDLSDSESASSYVSNSRKRKKMCKSPSVDSSSTISVLSSEKQNRFIRVSKIHYNANKKSMHVKQKRSKSHLKSNKCSSENGSSDDPCFQRHGTNINRQKMTIQLKEKSDTRSSSMKPLTVNVSLSNFEDNQIESDDISSVATDNSSIDIPKKCLNLGKKQTQLANSKRKIIGNNLYCDDNLNMSSSSDIDHNDFKRKYKINSNRKVKSFLNEFEDRKTSNSYSIDRRYKENKLMSKISETRSHNINLDSDYHSKSKMIYTSHKFLNEKDNKNTYLSRNRQNSDSPPLKRKKMRHEEISKANIYRSDKKLIDSSFNVDMHKGLKRHEYQHLSQEISSDAVFQKEFDDFKRDQASDQSSVHRKGNSSKVSSASSVGIKTFSSYDKYKSHKPAKSSKIKNVYTASPDCKNIFQIDMNNINMYESMYDKVKRRAQKQAETKVNQNSSEINEPRIKRKNKMVEHKHKTLKTNKVYYKRHKKPRDVVTSPMSTVYSDDSSAVIDDSQSNYSSTMYVTSEKGSVHRTKHSNRKIYKSTKNSTVSSFESPNSFSATNWKRSRNKNEMLRIFKYSSNKIPGLKYFTSKKLDNDYENDNEDHEQISEFSFKTNTSNINLSNKPKKEYLKNEMEEVANISDATGSTEPMEYGEVDLESLKMSDDDWKSGLSSQSSSESGNNLVKIELHNNEVSVDQSDQTNNEKQILSEKIILPNFPAENNSDLRIKEDSDDKLIDKLELDKVSKSAESEVKKDDNKEVESILIEVDNHECVKEEQDIAIASIMLKDENDSKSPIEWKSNDVSNELDKISPINDIFESSCNNENTITDSGSYNEITLSKSLETKPEFKVREFSECIISEAFIPICENVTLVSEPNNINVTDIESVFSMEKLINPTSFPVTSVATIEQCVSVVGNSQITVNENSNNKVAESKITNNLPTLFSSEIISVENTPCVTSVTNSRTNSKVQSQCKINNSPNEKIDLTSYVKGVIEQVKREQNAENQNKLKLEKTSNKRIKKINSNTNAHNKNSQSSNNSTNSNLSVSLLTTLQKSPAVSLQASVIEHSDPQASVSLHNPLSTPNIPGVNVCSPVTTINLIMNKSTIETVLATIPETQNNKTMTMRSSIINNLSNGSILKNDQSSNSTLTELKVNTELNSNQNSSELTSLVSDAGSNSSLKSPLSEDHTKQRICTRLRRADPTRSDSNYKIVTTTCATRSDVIGNNQSKPIIDNNNQTSIVNKPFGKQQLDNIMISEAVPDKISDPYEPNFDESPLEFSRYRMKAKPIFFSNDYKISKSSEETCGITPISSTSKLTSSNIPIISTSTQNSLANFRIDSVSQIIEDVVHGNFNYSEYLTSFKNGKLTSLQISPPTTPSTFISNDSRDCSSVSVENINSSNAETTSSSFKKQTPMSKVISHSNISVEDSKKTDPLSSAATNINSCNVFVTINKANIQKECVTSKPNTQSVPVSPVFNSSQPWSNSELLTLINLCKNKDVSSQKQHESVQQQSLPISTIQLQSYTRDVSSILSSSCTSPFEKDINNSNKLGLNFDKNISQNISDNNLLNINVNSLQSQQNINPPISSTVANQDDNNALKAYLSLLQRSNLTGLNVDSSTLSKLQIAITDSSLKNINSQSESNSYRNIQDITQLDSLTVTAIPENNQDAINPNLMGHSQNISARSIADLIIPRIYPLVWEGKLSLKNEEAKVALHFVHGNTELLNACMHLLIFSGSLQWNNNGSLKIVQRMRLDLSQLEGVQRRMQNSNEYCTSLALPGGDNITQWMKQSQILKEGFIKYMREKGAAGIINVCHPENNQQGLYVVHIFPPCDFSTKQLLSTAPDLQNVIEINKFPSLLVVITTV